MQYGNIETLDLAAFPKEAVLLERISDKVSRELLRNRCDLAEKVGYRLVQSSTSSDVRVFVDFELTAEQSLPVDFRSPKFCAANLELVTDQIVAFVHQVERRRFELAGVVPGLRPRVEAVLATSEGTMRLTHLKLGPLANDHPIKMRDVLIELAVEWDHWKLGLATDVIHAYSVRGLTSCLRPRFRYLIQQREIQAELKARGRLDNIDQVMERVAMGNRPLGKRELKVILNRMSRAA